MRLAIAASAMGMAVLFALDAGAETWPARRTSSTLAGLHRVIAVEPFVPREVGLLAAAGVGHARGVLCATDTHTRATGSLAASVGVQTWLALTLRLDGRHDQHRCPATDADSHGVAEPRLMLSARGAVSRAWHLGGHVRLWLPSASGVSMELDAATVDALAALTYAPPRGRARVAANVGVRVDRSAHLMDQGDTFTRARRLGLGASDSHAILAGVAATYRLGPVDVVGEWTWDWLVGEDAPDVRTSPMRVAAGARVPVAARWLAQVMVEAQVAESPRVWPGDPLVPFEPTVSITAGLRYRFRLPPISWPSWSDPAPEIRPARPGKLPARASKEPEQTEQPAQPAPPAPPEPPEPAVLTGRITSDSGEAVAHARVTVELPDQPLEVVADAGGRFRFDQVPAGAVTITARAPDFDSGATTVELAAGQSHEVELTLVPALPPAQLRGLVRSFRGAPLEATLTVEPRGDRADAAPVRQVTTRADGGFEIDVEPGRYVVVIRADGYRQQRRRVSVEEGGVTILNVDMSRK